MLYTVFEQFLLVFVIDVHFLGLPYLWTWVSGQYGLFFTFVFLYKDWGFISGCFLLLWGRISVNGLQSLNYFDQDFVSQELRQAYAVTSLIFQFILPSILVAWAYTRVHNRVNYCKQNISFRSSSTSCTSMRRANRRRRTNILLYLMSIIFFLSWAPLNILTVIINTYNPFKVRSRQHLCWTCIEN